MPERELGLSPERGPRPNHTTAEGVTAGDHVKRFGAPGSRMPRPESLCNRRRVDDRLEDHSLGQPIRVYLAFSLGGQHQQGSCGALLAAQEEFVPPGSVNHPTNLNRSAGHNIEDQVILNDKHPISQAAEAGILG